MKRLGISCVMLSLLLAGCNDGRTAEQKALEQEVMEFSKAITARGDMTRKSADAANVAEGKMNELKGKKLEKFTCTKTGMACTTNDKKFHYEISLYPDKFLSLNAREGDKITFTGSIKRIDTGIGSATVWAVVNAESDVVVAAK